MYHFRDSQSDQGQRSGDRYALPGTFSGWGVCEQAGGKGFCHWADQKQCGKRGRGPDPGP